MLKLLNSGFNPWGDSGSDHRKPQRGGGGQNPFKDLFDGFKPSNRPSGGGGSGNGFGGGGDNIFPALPSKKYLPYIAGGLVILWLLTGFYIVNPKENGVELIFGKLQGITQEGLNYNLPAPIGEVIKPEVTKVNQVEIGFRSQPNGINGGKSDYERESQMLTGDENIIDVQFVVFWRIKDAGKFIFSIRNPEESVRMASEATLREIIGKNDFEYIRTTGRALLAEQARQLLQNIMDNYSAGIEITNINLQRVDPPSSVIDSFRDVQAARADKERMINEATAYLNEQIEKARGESQQITQSAEAYKEEKISQAKGDSERFIQIYQEYAQNKQITRRRIYLETMEAIMGATNKIIVDDKTGVMPYLPLDRFKPKKAGE